MPAMPSIEWNLLAPLLIMVGTTLVVLIVDLASRSRLLVAGLALLGTLAMLIASYGLLSEVVEPRETFGGMFLVSQYSLFFYLIFGLSTILVILISARSLEQFHRRHGEYILLVLLATIGMMLMASANELVMVFLSLELMSLCLYVLAGYLRTSGASMEAGMKYLLLGAFASGFFLYGIALIYGSIGSTSIPAIAAQLPIAASSPLFLVGALLLIVGFGFKVALVPFHQWAPDVYEGAPTPVAAFISAGPKAAGFAAFFRIFVDALQNIQQEWVLLIAVLAALTMTVGNVIAIAQRNIKRMLAYSSIAHAGYVLVALAAASSSGVESAIFYLFIYSIMNIGAFGVVVLAEAEDSETVQIQDYAGLGFRRPFVALMMTIFLLSLAGFPPTAGFVGKLNIFKSALQADSGLTWLVVLGVLNAVVSAYYYLRVVVVMYMREPAEEIPFLPYASWPMIAVVLSVVGVLLLGIAPSLLLDPMQGALRLFM